MKFPVVILSLLYLVNNASAQPVIKKPGKDPSAIINQPIRNAPATTKYDFSNLKICIDKPIPSGTLPVRNMPPVRRDPKIKPDGTIDNTSTTQQGLVSMGDNLWMPGETITVSLATDLSNDFIRSKVIQYAKVWERYANIKFNFVSQWATAQIRVSFVPDHSSWSVPGRFSQLIPIGIANLNFGWFNNETTDEEFGRTVTHEFGHVLGFLHEHQSPLAPLQWDLDKTYAYFRDNGNWSQAQVYDQVIRKYSMNNTNFSAYDRWSIMCYPFPSSLLTSGGPGVLGNSHLSETDKTYAGIWYPFPTATPPQFGNFSTNDDCDLIAFNVEYDVVPQGQIEFVLSYGDYRGKKPSWWKQIGIPMKNNGEIQLDILNNSLIASENHVSNRRMIPFDQINVNKAISFAKAKALGFHTPLDFKWNVLSALRGGCRVTLLWNRETCQ